MNAMQDSTSVQSVPRNGTANSDEDVKLPDRLLREEKKVRRYQHSKVVAGRAMRRISNERLHRERGYSTLDEYAKAHFGITGSRWQQLVRHADTYDALKEQFGDDVTLPENEAQTRPLQKYRDETEVLTRVWKLVLERHADDLSRKKIKNVLYELLPEDSKERDTSSENPPTSNGSRREESAPEIESASEPEEEATDSSSEEEASEEDGTDDSDEQSSEDEELEEARSEFSPLLDDLNAGVARGLLKIAEVAAEDDVSERDAVQIARESFESLSHRGESESDQKQNLPGCITGDLDTISDRDILIAVPTEMLTSEMAKKAVPIGVPQAQFEVGVPLSYFDDRPPIGEIRSFYEEQDRTPRFNKTNEHVDWADYTTNPITGCLHTCPYCYSRYQAEELQRYKQGFQPTFFPGRLAAFSEMTAPKEIGHPREKNVFVGSMSDVFGKWVPNWMIQSILNVAEENEGFDHLFLTKFPQKLSQFEFPDNCWIGTTVDKKHRVGLAERHFADVEAKVKWLSCEPMLENLAPKFDDLSMFDCVVIGAQKGYGDEVEEKQPEFDWVMDLCQKAREADCKVYFKENLDIYPKELPEG